LTDLPHSTIPLPRLVVELAPGCTEARVHEIFEAGIAMLSQLSGEDLSARPWEVVTKRVRHERVRKPSIATLIKRAERTGKTVTSITTPDGTMINFSHQDPDETNNPWLADKASKQ
jgi:hypothetical protein